MAVKCTYTCMWLQCMFISAYLSKALVKKSKFFLISVIFARKINTTIMISNLSNNKFKYKIIIVAHILIKLIMILTCPPSKIFAPGHLNGGSACLYECMCVCVWPDTNQYCLILTNIN